MTDFMTALPVILVQPTCPGDQRAKGVQLQVTCNLCPESHKTQVWLCFLVLSFLSTYTCAASLSDTRPLQGCLQLLKGDIEKSDAMLYTPTSEDIKENCKIMSLGCYMQELMMVIEEEGAVDTPAADCIFDYYSGFREHSEAKVVGCPPCEVYSLKNITIFLDRLNILLQELTTAEHLL